ncbi:MAG: hypothetical protein SGI90_05480 [Candidatus Eisenbacteria bacterium]|nr:hypothetical protein [Candidatus Eisenbacteria bacterium]
MIEVSGRFASCVRRVAVAAAIVGSFLVWANSAAAVPTCGDSLVYPAGVRDEFSPPTEPSGPSVLIEDDTIIDDAVLTICECGLVPARTTTWSALKSRTSY